MSSLSATLRPLRGLLRRPPAQLSRAPTQLAARAMCAWDPPPGLRPPPPPPDHNSAERIDVLFPRRGAFKASMEVKKRVLKSVPHMGGKRLKQLVRHHARHGTMNSFVGDFESRLDKFLYRLNLVPSIFTARHAIGLRNVLVNGRSVNSPGHLLKPMDIVEPRPGREFLFKRWIRERLNRNTFVEGNGACFADGCCVRACVCCMCGFVGGCINPRMHPCA